MEQNDDLQAYIADLEQQYNQLVEYNNQGRAAYQELLDQYESLADDYDTVQENREQLADEYRQLAEYYSELEQENTKLKETASINGDLNGLTGDRDTLVKETETLRDEQQRLTEQITQLEKIQAQLASEIGELEEYRDAIQKASYPYAEGLHDFTLALDAMRELVEKEQSRTRSGEVYDSDEDRGGRHSR